MGYRRFQLRPNREDWTPRLVLASIIFLSFVGFSPVAITGLAETVGGIPQGDGDLAKQLSFMLLFVVIIRYVLLKSGLRGLIRAIPLPFVILLGWCWLSTIWAIDPAIAIRRTAFVTVVIISINYAVRSMSYKTTTDLLIFCFAAILLADWLSMGLFHLATHQPNEIEFELAGDWRGLQDHKNEAGAFSALCIMIFLYGCVIYRSRIVFPALVLLSAIFLYETQSKTAGGFLPGAMLIGFCFNFIYVNSVIRKAAAAACVAFVVFIFCFFFFLNDISSFASQVLADPSAFTGRSQIWPILVEYANDHFWLGSGYGSFWAIGDTSPMLDYASGWVVGIDQGHNGYLNILVQTGAIGLTLSIFTVIVYPVYLLSCKQLHGGPGRWLLGSIAGFAWLHDLFESSLLDRANLTWVTMMIVYSCLVEASRRIPSIELIGRSLGFAADAEQSNETGLLLGVKYRVAWQAHPAAVRAEVRPRYLANSGHS